MSKWYSTISTAIAFVAIGLSPLGVGAALAQDQPWTLQESSLPLPTGASNELKEHLARLGQPDLKASQEAILATNEDWIRFIARADEHAITAAGALAKRLNARIREDKIADVTVFEVTPASINPANAKRLFVHVHGRAYVLNGGRAGLSEAIAIADRAGIPVVSIDYRMPPEHPFPAAVDDVVAAWRSLIKDRGPTSMALGGTSAGGGLILASTLNFKSLDLPLPGALFAGTPWADLTKTEDSYYLNAGVDTVLVSYDDILAGAAKLYAGDADLTNPLISPVYGNFDGFPPTYLVTGTRDLFLSNTVRTHRKLRTAGVKAELNVYESLSHGEYLSVLEAPETQQIFDELRAFLSIHLKYLIHGRGPALQVLEQFYRTSSLGS